QVESRWADPRLHAGHLLLRAALSKGYKRLWTEGETGESAATHRKGITRSIAPFGVCLERRRGPLRDRRRYRLFGNWGSGVLQPGQHEYRTDEDQREEEQQTLSAHARTLTAIRNCDRPPLLRAP